MASLSIKTLGEAIFKHIESLCQAQKINPGERPGLSEARIRELTSGLPFQLTSAAVEMYEWYDGITVDFFPGYGFDPLEKSLDIYRQLAKSDDHPRFSDGNKHWFPMFRSSGVDFYCQCCTTTPSDDGEIIADDNELGIETAFVSLESMLKTLLECYETGVFFINPHATLEADQIRFQQVAAKYNSNPT